MCCRIPILCLAPCLLVALIAGCGDDELATLLPPTSQPVTDKDRATTQPTYYLNQPTVAEVQASDFDKLWHACEETARHFLFQLDREDFRDGLITTKPMVSKQWLEFWRPDTGTSGQVLQNSLASIRRTVYFRFTTNADGTFTVVPKVLVERETILERRITDVSLYRLSFSGPPAPVEKATDLPPWVPAIYWTPIARDTALEKQLAASIEKDMKAQ